MDKLPKTSDWLSDSSMSSRVTKYRLLATRKKEYLEFLIADKFRNTSYFCSSRPFDGKFSSALQLFIRFSSLHKLGNFRKMKQWCVDAGTIAEGSSDQAFEGHHYYRCMRVPKQIFWYSGSTSLISFYYLISIWVGKILWTSKRRSSMLKSSNKKTPIYYCLSHY